MMCSVREHQVLVKCDKEKSGKLWVQDVENSVVRRGLPEKTSECSEGASQADISLKNVPGLVDVRTGVKGS